MNDEMFASHSVLKIRVHMVLSLVVSDGLVPPCDAVLRAPTVSQFSLYLQSYCTTEAHSGAVADLVVKLLTLPS